VTEQYFSSVSISIA